MRTRHRTKDIGLVEWAGATGTAKFYDCSNSNFQNNSHSWPGYSLPLARTSEAIVDVKRGLGKSNPVWHRKMTSFISEVRPALISPNTGAPYGRIEYSENLWPRWQQVFENWMVGSGVRSWPVIPDNNWYHWMPPKWSIDKSSINESSLREDLFEKAAGMKADVLLNIVEGNQVWPSIKSLAGSLPAMARNWKHIRKVIKTASGGFLAWKFGVSPILSDIKSINRYLGVMKKDISKHASGDVTRFSVEAKPTLTFSDAPWVINSANGGVANQITYKGRIVSEPSVRFVLVVKPRVQYYSDLFTGLDTLMSRFTSSPASLAWEKIPFSFVLDWFVDMRGVLRTLDNCLGFHPYTIVSASRSFSYTVETTVAEERYSTCASHPLISRYDVGAVEYRHYERSPFLGGNLPTGNTRFGKNQAAISVALIAQQLLKTLRVR